ncbi:MAG: IspD/TarI family cytidylyltransferase [Actinomycetota bacterium]
MTDAVALLLAGGSGTRMGAEQNKVYLPIGGRAVIDRPLAVLDRSTAVSRIVLVVRADDRPLVDAAVTRVVRSTPVTVVEGGATRTGSELAGLAVVAAAPPDERPDVVLIHDAARPFLTADLLDELIETAHRHGGAVPGVEVTEPIVEAVGDGTHRARGGRLARVQTPQAFATDALLAAYDGLDPTAASVDTAHVLELRSTVPVRIVASDDRNLKVTRHEDLERADQLASRWDDGRWIDP